MKEFTATEYLELRLVKYIDQQYFKSLKDYNSIKDIFDIAK
jgi:hypothetical protein